jgi:hypothetical protein
MVEVRPCYHKDWLRFFVTKTMHRMICIQDQGRKGPYGTGTTCPRHRNGTAALAFLGCLHCKEAVNEWSKQLTMVWMHTGDQFSWNGGQPLVPVDPTWLPALQFFLGGAALRLDLVFFRSWPNDTAPSRSTGALVDCGFDEDFWSCTGARESQRLFHL